MKLMMVACLAVCGEAQLPNVHDIMLRVAFNQAKSQDARRQFVFREKQTVRLRRANGNLAREEYREYQIAPTERGIHRELLTLHGRYEEKGDYVLYDRPQHEVEGVATGIDAGLIEGFSEDWNTDNSRDGIANELFPLTYHQQLKYNFRLVKAETYRGRAVYRVAFEPKKRFEWKGEALIDATDYQPVFVTTKMAHGVPLAVKTLLGSDVKGLGFSVSYQRFGDGVWFPVSYGGEFELRVLFFYRRTISISLTNVDFQHVDVNSVVRYSSDTQ